MNEILEILNEITQTNAILFGSVIAIALLLTMYFLVAKRRSKVVGAQLAKREIRTVVFDPALKEESQEAEVTKPKARKVRSETVVKKVRAKKKEESLKVEESAPVKKVRRAPRKKPVLA